MSARQQALLDIREDLRATNRTFIAFSTSLNPVMRALVREQLQSQLMARCSVKSGKVVYENFHKYYRR